MKITKEFLESKSYSHNVGWGAGIIEISSSSGNLNRVSENVFSFIEYNFLPCDGSKLDGHYRFYVNYKTFNYVVFKDSEFGSLTYTLPTKEKGIISLNEIDKKIVEAIIASKLLNAYFYDFDAINSKGINLIPTTKIVEHKDYYDNQRKQCLITDYRNYIWSDFKPNEKTNHDYIAIEKLEIDIRVKILDISFSNLVKNKEQNTYKFTISFLCNGIKKEIDLYRKSSYCGLTLYIVSNNKVLLSNSVSIKNLKPFKQNLVALLTMICENNLI